MDRHETSEQIPYSTQPSRSKRLLIWLGFVLLLLLFYLYVREFRYFSNTFEVGRLILYSMIPGAVVGGLLGWRIQKEQRDPVDRIRTFLLVFLPIVLFAPLLGSLSNRLPGTPPVENRSFEFWENDARISSRFGLTKGEKPKPDAYFLYFVRAGKIERIKSKTPLYETARRGDTITLPIRRGLWGYEWVEVR